MAKRKKRIGLFGGSFNPPHEGHLQAALHVFKEANLDEMWLMVTPQNPLKDPEVYASLEHRMALCKLMVEPHKEFLKVSDIERYFHTNQTSEVLESITHLFPDYEFVWIMGTDNLISFHEWKDWQYIIDNFSIAVTERQGQREKALDSIAAKYAAKRQVSDPTKLGHNEPSWCIMQNPASDIQARKVVAKIKEGKATISSIFNDLSKHEHLPQFEKIAEYITKHGLYGCKKEERKTPPKKPSL